MSGRPSSRDALSQSPAIRSPASFCPAYPIPSLSTRTAVWRQGLSSPFVVSLSNHNWGLRQAQAERQGTTLSQQWKGPGVARVQMAPIRIGWRGVGPARPGWAAGRVQTQILNRLGLGMPASRILSKGRFIQMLSALGVVPGSRERRRLGRSFLLIDLGYAGAYSQMYLP